MTIYFFLDYIISYIIYILFHKVMFVLFQLCYIVNIFKKIYIVGYKCLKNLETNFFTIFVSHVILPVQYRKRL